MKLKSILTLAAAAILGLIPASPLTAADKHDHEHAAKAGPTGGKLLTEVEPHAEFLVTKDRKVEIRFVGEDNKVVAPAAQVVTVTLGERSKPTKLTFTKDGDKLVSDKAVPEGNDYPTVVEIKADAKAKPVRSKFNLNLTQCPTCAHPEYACTCDHDDHGDDAKKDEDKKAKK
ncbi:MAG: hypothetical protein EOP86_01215 [Verrucomicrobiaceae bacterium]|nr:MAG: hypothetical protein EOP86_01215 [Verrucomicrobiaceae bacterium]